MLRRQILLKCLVAVLTVIAFGLSFGLVEAKVRVSVLVKDVLIANSAPAKKLYSVSPFLLFDLGVRRECDCPDSFMAGFWSDNTKPHCDVETSVVHHLSRLFVKLPRVFLHDSTRVGHPNVISRGISSVFYGNERLS